MQSEYAPKGLNVLDWQRAHIGEPALAKALSKLTGKPVKSTGKGSADLFEPGRVLAQAKNLPGTGAIPTGFALQHGEKCSNQWVADHPDAARVICWDRPRRRHDPMTYESMGSLCFGEAQNLSA